MRVSLALEVDDGRYWTYELRVRVDLDTEDTLEAARFLEVTPVAARRAGRMACEREDMTSVSRGVWEEGQKQKKGGS